MLRLRPPSFAPLTSLPGIACGEVVLRTTKTGDFPRFLSCDSTTREAMRGRLRAQARRGSAAPHYTKAKSGERDSVAESRSPI